MYTLKGIFPEPKKVPKKNFIKENVKQLKHIQGKVQNEPKLVLKTGRMSRVSHGSVQDKVLATVKSSASTKSGRPTISSLAHSASTNCHTKKQSNSEIKIKKGDMAEFLKRKEMRLKKMQGEIHDEDSDDGSENSGRLRNVACQTVESNLPQKIMDNPKLTVLYPTNKDQIEDTEYKAKASGDTGRNKSPKSPNPPHCHLKSGDMDALDSERNRSKLQAVLDSKKEKDPYLPAGYQKGVLPKYLRERKEQNIEEDVMAESHAVCPAGHVTLPDAERKETLRMLRNSFAELVSELNKMPVRTDTLRMRNRKMELEKQLTKLEEGIKVFSRPKVFVKVGE